MLPWEIKKKTVQFGEYILQLLKDILYVKNNDVVARLLRGFRVICLKNRF